MDSLACHNCCRTRLCACVSTQCETCVTSQAPLPISLPCRAIDTAHNLKKGLGLGRSYTKK